MFEVLETSRTTVAGFKLFLPRAMRSQKTHQKEDIMARILLPLGWVTLSLFTLSWIRERRTIRLSYHCSTVILLGPNSRNPLRAVKSSRKLPWSRKRSSGPCTPLLLNLKKASLSSFPSHTKPTAKQKPSLPRRRSRNSCRANEITISLFLSAPTETRIVHPEIHRSFASHPSFDCWDGD